MRTGAHWPYAELCFRGGACWDTPLDADIPLGADTPREQTHTPPSRADPPEQTPREQTPLQIRHPPRAEPPPVNRMPDTSKNITLATTSLRPVKIAPCEQQCVKYKDDATANAVCERTWKKFFLLKTIILKEPVFFLLKHLSFSSYFCIAAFFVFHRWHEHIWLRFYNAYNLDRKEK